MNEEEIVKALSKSGKLRVKLYLNDDQIREIFVQQVSAISQLTKGDSIDVGVSAGLGSVNK